MTEYTISKELFEAVMNRNDITKNIKVIYKDITYFCEVDWNEQSIPLNDFFFKCKVWADKLGYVIGSYSDGLVFLTSKEEPLRMIEWKKFSENPKPYASEQQEVFEACEWILENKKGN